MTYRVIFAESARQAFEALSRDVQLRLKPRIDRLAGNPRPPGVKKLAGLERTWRLRTGDYRIVYEIRDRELLVLIVKIGHRREVYRGS